MIIFVAELRNWASHSTDALSGDGGRSVEAV